MLTQQDENADLQIVEQFFAARELTAKRIPETETKTPDFEIRRGRKVVAYCEVKSPQDVVPERLNEAIRSGRRGIIDTGYRNDYRQARCVERAAIKGEPQFAAVNPGHTVPNILIVVNHDTTCVYEDFAQAITGLIPELMHPVGGAVRDLLKEIDAYVWIDASGRTSAQPQRLFRHENKLKETVRELLQLG